MSLSDGVVTHRRDRAWSVATRLAQEYGPSRASRAVLWPAFPDESTAQAHLTRAAWYSGDALQHLAYSAPGSGEPGAVRRSVAEVDGIAEEVVRMPEIERLNKDEFQALVGRRDVRLLVWDAAALRLRDARRTGRLRIVDPLFHDKCEALTTARLVRWDFESRSDGRRRVSVATERWARMVDQFGSTASVGVFGTGPGLDHCTPAVAADFPVRISCNSIVLAADSLDRVRPNVICFGDPVFHFGFSRQAAEFRRAVDRAIEHSDPWIVAPMENGGWLDDLSDRSERVIQIPLRRVRRFNAVSKKDFFVRRTGNILTGLMLPVAAGLGTNLAIFGCDGRPPTETKFWGYGAGLHDAALYGTAEASHPSFFRDRDYLGYYHEHCSVLKAQLGAFERAGRTFQLGSPSQIPALDELGSPIVGAT